MLDSIEIDVNQGASRTDEFKLVDSRSGSPVVVPDADVVSVKLELRSTPDRSSEILETLTLTRTGDIYPITLDSDFTSANPGNVWGDIKFELVDGFKDYAARLRYNIGETTTV